MSKLIPVGDLFAIVDDEDYEYLSQFSWRVYEDGRNVYARIRRSGSKGMHVILTGFALTDHVNGNGLDNRRENLRHSTMSQNKANASKYRTYAGVKPVSEFKGVTYHAEKSKPWRARVRFQGSLKHIGYFFSEVEAAKAYDRAALQYFGEFARTNF